MHRQHVPSMGLRYWLALTIASIFGANTGDAFAGVFGFVSGLPILIILFAAIIVLEQRDAAPREVYYWSAIVVVRTAATNLADFASHAIGIVPALALLTALIVAAVIADRSLADGSASPAPGVVELPPTGAMYWTLMLIAGTLGTALGDFTSFRSGLGLANAALSLSALEAVMIAAGSAGLLAIAIYYWFTIVTVRAAMTTVGDFAARRIGLLPSTLVFGVLLVAVLLLWKERRAEITPSKV